MIAGSRVSALLLSLVHHLPIYCSKKPANAKPSLWQKKKKKSHYAFYLTFKIFRVWAWGCCGCASCWSLAFYFWAKGSRGESHEAAVIKIPACGHSEGSWGHHWHQLRGPDFLISKARQLPRISFWQRGADPCQTVNFYALKKYIAVLNACFQPHIFFIRWTGFSPPLLTYGLDFVVFEVCGFCNTGSNILAAFELGESYTALLTTVHPHAAICIPSF